MSKKQVKQYKQFYVVEANFLRSFTGHGPDAIDAEMKVEGEFGTVYLTYNDFGGERFGVSKQSVLATMRDDEAEPVEFIEEWEGGLEETKRSKYYLGFKALSEFSDRMAYLNVNYKKETEHKLEVEGKGVWIDGRKVGDYRGYTKVEGAKHGIYCNVNGKEYLVEGKLEEYINSIKDLPQWEFQALLEMFVADLEPDIIDGVAVKKARKAVKPMSKARAKTRVGKAKSRK